MIIYKIQSKQTGLYSTGGVSPSFSKTGKVWKNIGHLRNHINVLDPHGKRKYREHQVEIVELQLTEVCVSSTPFEEFLTECTIRKNDRDAKQREKIDYWKQDQRKRLYLELKKEFGS